MYFKVWYWETIESFLEKQDHWPEKKVTKLRKVCDGIDDRQIRELSTFVVVLGLEKKKN